MKRSDAIIGSFHRLAARFQAANSGIAPLDLRICLCLLALPLAYKILSIDFSALGTLCSRPTIFTLGPQAVQNILNETRCTLFSGSLPRVMQIVDAACLIGLVWRPSRVFLGVAIGITWLLDTNAAYFRYNIYTLSTPLALLTLIFFAPINLRRAAAMDTHPNSEARLGILICMLYVATYYVMAGVAKIEFSLIWPFVVKVGNYYPISELWHGQIMPEPINAIAKASSDTLIAHPWLDYFSSSIVFVEQFIWILAPFSVFWRIHAALFSTAYHVAVALTTGIVFFTWIFIPVAVAIHFSHVLRQLGYSLLDQSTLETSPAPLERTRLGYACLLAIGLVLYPSLIKDLPPFYNFKAFGWRYLEVSEIKSVYRIGYIDVESKASVPLPLHHGAFLDFIHNGMLDVTAKLLVEHPDNPAIQKHYRTQLGTLLLALRPSNANGWLLGPFRSPNHLLSEPGTVEIHTLKHFRILKGTPLPYDGKRPATLRWAICGNVDLDGINEPTIHLFGECRDG